jgi:hypothetical protein
MVTRTPAIGPPFFRDWRPSSCREVAVTLFPAILLPLAVLLGMLGALVGGNAGRVLLIAAAILAGVDLVLVLLGR